MTLTSSSYEFSHKTVEEFKNSPTRKNLEKVKLCLVALFNDRLDPQIRTVEGVLNSPTELGELVAPSLVEYLHTWIEVERMKLNPMILGATFENGLVVEWDKTGKNIRVERG